VSRIATIENRRLELLSWMQDVAKIKWIEATGHADGIELICSTVMRQEPLHASAPNQTSPWSSLGSPAWIANHGLA